MELTVNNAARKAVSIGVSKIPEAGEVISTLLDALWPEDEADAWDGLKDQAEQLIGQKLSELVYSQATGKLQGLHNVLDDYGQALRDSARHKSYITEKYNVALGAFELLQEDFKTKDYEVTLLPLFAQMVNLHLALLRDGVLNGVKWGWTRAAVWTLSQRLEAESDRCTQWVTTLFKVGYDSQPNLPEFTKSGFNVFLAMSDSPQVNWPTQHYTSLQWNSHNRYVREMTAQVLDYAYYWPYFSPRKGLAPKLTREIYSDLFGTADVNPVRVSTQSVERLSCINIFAWDWPYRIELSYDPAARPNPQ